MNKFIHIYFSFFFIIYFCFLPGNKIIAQYSRDDYDLIKTTYTREFNKNIIIEYLHSDNTNRVIAALLSIGHSKDVSFIPFLLNLDYNKYGDYITFALGQIGYTEKSIEYLKSKLLSNENSFTRECYEAFGKIARTEDLNFLAGKFNDLNSSQRSGFSLAVANFAAKGKNNFDDKVRSILFDELSNQDAQRILDALFTLSRIGATKEKEPEFASIIKTFLDDNNSYTIVKYALACLRTNSSFPDDFDMVKKLVNHPAWNVRSEALQSICYYKFKSIDELEIFFDLMLDNNPSVARQAAISLSAITLDEKLKLMFEERIKNFIENKKLTNNSRGELIVSYASLFPSKSYSIIEQYQYSCGNEFILRILTNYVDDPNYNFAYLNIELISADNKLKIIIYPAMLALQSNFYNNENYIKVIAESLYSEFPAVISIVADGIDKTFAKRHAVRLKEIINHHTANNLNNIEYTDALQSLERLSNKISRSYNREILSRLQSSRLFSLKNYIADKQNKHSITLNKSTENFEQLWSAAFKYYGAEVSTERGKFTIKFHSAFAPVTVANFCLLAESGFFDNITFHRVVPNFVIQSGDKTGTGWGGPGYEIISEFSPLPFSKDYVGMASSGKDTEGSQWFVMHAYYPHLNGRYSNFGKVVTGNNVIGEIDQNDKILQVKLIQ